MTRIALLSPYLEHIGDVRTIPVLAHALAKRGFKVDLLRAWKEWDHVQLLDPSVRVVSLKSRRFAPFLPSIRPISKWASYRLQAGILSAAMTPGLISYVNKERPDVLIVRLLTTPVIIANVISGHRTRVIVNTGGVPRRSGYRDFLWPRVYRLADGHVSCGHEVAEVVSSLSGIPMGKVAVIHDPVLDPSAYEQARQMPEHPWFKDDEYPVVLGLGRLTRQKDFATLIRAFAIVRKMRKARLLIYGVGEQEQALRALINNLGIAEYAQLGGFTDNPYAALTHATVFVLSSQWEGMSHALIEAVSLGAPCVSTACPAGQREILLDGAAGQLVEPGNPQQMAEAIRWILEHPEEARLKASAGVDASSRFDPEHVADKWVDYLTVLLSNRRRDTS